MKSLALVVLAVLALGLGLHGAHVGLHQVPYMSGHALSEAEDKAPVGFIGTLVDQRTSRSGKRLLVLDTADGYQLTALLSADVPDLALESGHRYALQATAFKPGLVLVSRADGVQAVTTATSRGQAMVEVDHGTAYLATSAGTVRLHTSLADGIHEVNLVEVNGHGGLAR